MDERALEGPRIELAETRASDERCPYCLASIDTAAAVACVRCRTLHHEECFAEHGKCVTLACGEPRSHRAESVAAPPRPGTRRRRWFVARAGSRFGEPSWLEIGDYRFEPGHRAAALLELALAPSDVRPGDSVRAVVTLALPDGVRARAVSLSLRAARVRAHRLEPEVVLEREAMILAPAWTVFGESSRASLLAPLRAAVARLAGRDELALPSGTSRFDARLTLDPLHPPLSAESIVLTEVVVRVDVPGERGLVVRAPLRVSA